MAQGTLLPNHAEVKLLCLRPKDGAIQMEVQGCRARVTCPVCGTPSGRVHSRYARRFGDLPWEGLPVRIVLSTRRFYCVDEGPVTLYKEQWLRILASAPEIEAFIRENDSKLKTRE